MRVGNISTSAAGLPKAEASAMKAQAEAAIRQSLAAAGYPAKADPARMNLVGAFGVLMVFVIAATALYGPMAACLVELFPTRIRYTAMSLPYHVGTGWIGGFLPVTSFALVAITGNIYAGLWYAMFFTAVSIFVATIFFWDHHGKPLENI